MCAIRSNKNVLNEHLKSLVIVKKRCDRKGKWPRAGPFIYYARATTRTAAAARRLSDRHRRVAEHRSALQQFDATFTRWPAGPCGHSSSPVPVRAGPIHYLTRSRSIPAMRRALSKQARSRTAGSAIICRIQGRIENFGRGLTASPPKKKINWLNFDIKRSKV